MISVSRQFYIICLLLISALSPLAAQGSRARAVEITATVEESPNDESGRVYLEELNCGASSAHNPGIDDTSDTLDSRPRVLIVEDNTEMNAFLGSGLEKFYKIARAFKLGQGPNARVKPIGRIPGAGAIEVGRERAHLIFECAQRRANVTDLALLIKR